MTTEENKVADYETYLINSIMYLIVGAILYARSKSLASYFIAALENDEEPASQNQNIRY